MSEIILHNTDDVFRGVGIKVDILNPDNFLKIKETLSRIGISPKGKNILYQSCHILHKRNTKNESLFAIVHFKEMFMLDKKETNFSKEDMQRRNMVCKFLEDWGLVKLLNNEEKESVNSTIVDMTKLKIIPFAKKDQYQLVEKYTIGKKFSHVGNIGNRKVNDRDQNKE